MGYRESFNMEIQCSGQAQENYDKLKAKLEGDKQQGKLAQVSKLSFDDAAKEVLATGTGFKSKIQCHDGKVVIDLELNFLLKAMRVQIEETIRKSLTKALV